MFLRSFIISFLAVLMLGGVAFAQTGGPVDMAKGLAGSLSIPYDIAFSVSGTPTAGQIYPYIATRSITFPASLTSSTYPDTSSKFSCGTSPGTQDVYLLKKNGTTQCTLTISTATPCIMTPTTCTSSWSVAAGDILTLVAPGTLFSEANLAFTLAGHSP
jgi:hypothetical protein